MADAYQHDEQRLPHTYVDPERLFPRAEAVEVVKEDEDLEPDDLEKSGLELGKAKGKSLGPLPVTLCMALYPSAYEAQGTRPLCATITGNNYYDQKQPTTGRQRDYNGTTGAEKSDALRLGGEGPQLIPNEWPEPGARNDLTWLKPSVGQQFHQW